MFRLTAALLLAGCLTFQSWAQTPSSNQPPATSPAAEQASTGPAASVPEPSLFPLDKFKEFSAIMTGGPVPGTDDPIHIYRSGDLMRMEANEGNSYQITDLAKHDTHGISKGACLHYKAPYIRTYPFSFSSPANKFERVPVGKETVDGHLCQVEDVIITLPKNPTTPKFRLWEAEDLQGFPVKVETKAHLVMHYTNVVLGPQDPTLFIFPDKCESSDEIGPPPKSSKPTPKSQKAPPPKSQ